MTLTDEQNYKLEVSSSYSNTQTKPLTVLMVLAAAGVALISHAPSNTLSLTSRLIPVRESKVRSFIGGDAESTLIYAADSSAYNAANIYSDPTMPVMPISGKITTKLLKPKSAEFLPHLFD